MIKLNTNNVVINGQTLSIPSVFQYIQLQDGHVYAHFYHNLKPMIKNDGHLVPNVSNHLEYVYIGECDKDTNLIYDCFNNVECSPDDFESYKELEND